MKKKKIHIKLKVHEQLVPFQKREQGPGAPVEMDQGRIQVGRTQARAPLKLENI